MDDLSPGRCHTRHRRAGRRSSTEMCVTRLPGDLDGEEDLDVLLLRPRFSHSSRHPLRSGSAGGHDGDDPRLGVTSLASPPLLPCWTWTRGRQGLGQGDGTSSIARNWLWHRRFSSVSPKQTAKTQRFLACH